MRNDPLGSIFRLDSDKSICGILSLDIRGKVKSNHTITDVLGSLLNFFPTLPSVYFASSRSEHRVVRNSFNVSPKGLQECVNSWVRPSNQGVKSGSLFLDEMGIRGDELVREAVFLWPICPPVSVIESFLLRHIEFFNLFEFSMLF